MKKFINNALDSIRKKFVGNRRNQEDKLLAGFFKRYVKPDALILDVGCGLGHNLTLLKNNGYLNAGGVDISIEMLTRTKEKGHLTFTADDLKSQQNKFDVILFSHILEHIEYRDIQKFLESYLKLAKPDSLVIVCMPLMYDGFYHDVDHIKPYYVKGLTSMFSNISIPKQYSSEFQLNLIDLRYLRASLVPYHLRSRHVRSVGNYIILGSLTLFFALLKIGTLGMASKLTSYAAIFELKKT